MQKQKKKAFWFITAAVLCLVPICWVAGQFDSRSPQESVYSGTFNDLKRTEDQWTLTDVNIRLQALPEGFIKEPMEIWPASKLTPEGIYAHADLQITGICTDGYEGATAYLTKLIREAQNRIIIKNMMWMGWWVADSGYDKVGIECEIYIIKDGKEINVGEQMIEAGYASACGGC